MDAVGMPPVVVVHDAAGAAAALALTGPRGVLLLSAPGAAGNLGPAWFLAMLAEAAAGPIRCAAGGPVEAVLDCGDSPGHALAALRAGARLLVLDGACPAHAAVAAAAMEVGARVLPARPAPALDLREIDPGRPGGRARLAAWLAGDSGGG